MKFDFSHKQVLVTGASRGIGYVVAGAFVEAGATVAILAEDEGIYHAAKQLEQLGTTPVTALRCDITDRKKLSVAVKNLSSVDILVANAGTGDITPIDDQSKGMDDTIDRLIHINLLGTFNTVRAVLSLMPGGARIIFTSSVHGQSIAPPGMSAYAASKAGIEALMRSLARELGPRRINVNAVAPGMVTTELTLGAIRKLFSAQISDKQSSLSEEDMIKQLNTSQAIYQLPVDPAKLAQVYLFLASEAGGEITGQSINVDHGMEMK